jgi:hypothetical protein
VHDLSKFSEKHIKGFDGSSSDYAYFFRFSDPTSKYFYWPAEEVVPERDNYVSMNRKTLEKLRDPAREKKEKKVNAPGTGYKIPQMEPKYIAKI